MLDLAPGLVDALLAAARAAAPSEACGLLGGLDGELRRILRAAPCRNVAEHAAWEFRAHPQDQLDAMLAFEAEGLEPLGVWHSHPRGPPRPSAVDAARAAFPGWTHVIVWLHPAEGWGAWRWQPPRFEAERVGNRI